MRYSVFQVHLSKNDIDWLNAGVETTLTTEWMRNRSFAKDAPMWLIFEGHFQHAAEITTDADLDWDEEVIEADLENVFRIGNIGPRVGTGVISDEDIKTGDRFHSISVGDLVVDPADNVWHVQSFGWQKIGTVTDPTGPMNRLVIDETLVAAADAQDAANKAEAEAQARYDEMASNAASYYFQSGQ
jgi:hypothetical protein